MNNARRIKIAIDASSIRSGGGLLHLIKIIEQYDMEGVGEVAIWASPASIDQIGQKSKLTLHAVKAFDVLVLRMLYRWFVLVWKFRRYDVVFFPGGLILGDSKKSVVMCQNLQPFLKEDRVAAKGWQRIRLELLRFFLSRSFQKARKVIFVSEFSRDQVESYLKKSLRSSVVAHGCNESFFSIGENRSYDFRDGLQVVYVSTINSYKNQDVALRAVYKLRQEGVPITITLVGGECEPYASQLRPLIRELDAGSDWIANRGLLSFSEVEKELKKANCGLFLSSCETFGISLLEKMASGLPIICSDVRPMSDLAGEAAFRLVDPKDVDAVANALRDLYREMASVEKYGKQSYAMAQKYKWSIAANKTFDEIVDVVAK